MAGIHGLQHIESLGSPYFPYHDAVRPHTQRVNHQVADGILSPAFDVGRAAFQGDNIVLAQLQFCCIFNGNDALTVGDKAREDV